MVNILEYVDSKRFSTIKTGGKFRYFTIISSKEDLRSFYDITQNDGRLREVPVFVLGGGSNIIFSDGVINVIALKNEIKGFEVINNNNDFVDIKVGSGEDWDDIVEKFINMGLSGAEPMSFIPGTVGAMPVQNVGAYGSEAKDIILDVEVFNIKDNSVSNISNKDCGFAYRDSIFKNEARGKYFIISVTFRLYKNKPNIPDYPGVSQYFENKNIINPNLSEIRDAIVSIRKDKLPNPKELPNVGSFFKNPIVLREMVNKIEKEFPNIKFFEVDNLHVKIPAGWLIENSGLKGQSFGKVSVYNKNALVLVNDNNGGFNDVVLARDKIIEIVKNKFGIVLEQEPEIV